MAVTRGATLTARTKLWLGLSCYVLFLSVSPLLHHDLDCHFKTPSHCGVCMASPLGLSAAPGAPLDDIYLHDVGRVTPVRAKVPEFAFAVDAPGRSPPA